MMKFSVQESGNSAALKRALLKDIVIIGVVSIVITGILGVLFFTNALTYLLFLNFNQKIIVTTPDWTHLLMALLISLVVSAILAYSLIRNTLRQHILKAGGISYKRKKTRSRFERDGDLETVYVPSSAPIQADPVTQVDNKATDTLKAEMNQLQNKYDTLQNKMNLEQQFNELMLALLKADDADIADRQQNFLRIIASYFQSDYSALYLANDDFSNYTKQADRDSNPDIARHSIKVESLNPQSYPWTFKQVKAGNPFIFHTATLDGLLSQFDAVAEDAKAWLQMKLEDTSEYLLCKHEAWEHLIALPCMKDDILQSILIFGYHSPELPVNPDFIENMQPIVATLIKSMLKTPVTPIMPTEESDLQAALQKLGYGVILTDPDGNILMANQAAHQLKHTSEADIRKLTFDTAFSFIDLAGQIPVKDFFHKLISTPHDHPAATIHLLRDATENEVKVELDVVPVNDAQNNTKGYFILMNDISLRISREAERVNDSNQEAIGYLSARLAHDFNNLLTAILGNISLALEEVPSDSDTAKLLKAAEDSTLKGKTLTDQLLTFAKSSPPEKAISETKTSLIRAIDTLLADTNVKAEYQIDDDLPYIDMAQDAFNTVISNLVMNAMQAMHNKGELNVKAAVVSKNRDNDLPLKRGKYVCIHLIDNGEGITPENKTRIFIPHFTTQPGKSGMGLSNVYAILKRYNGHINVNSQLGSGTDVEIYIPATDTLIPALEIPSQPVKQNIVLLKDADMLRNLLVNTMEKMDLCVQTTADPEEMIEICDQARTGGNPVSMVIIDFNVPGVEDFLPYVNKLKAAIPAPKLIASRGFINPDEVSNFHNMGFDDILSKPFHISEFKNIINRSLNF